MLLVEGYKPSLLLPLEELYNGVSSTARVWAQYTKQSSFCITLVLNTSPEMNHEQGPWTRQALLSQAGPSLILIGEGQ